MSIPDYPQFGPILLEDRPVLHPLFQRYNRGVSEFSFANMYLFRQTHRFEIARISQDNFVFRGEDSGGAFFLLPFALPEKPLLEELFTAYVQIKTAGEAQAADFQSQGYTIREDRDNFDYLYLRQDLTLLKGNRYHSKRNQLNAFIKKFEATGRPFLPQFAADAAGILDAWRAERPDDGDYAAVREALALMEPLQLCGYIYYVGDEPVGFTLGEENDEGRTFVVKIEKACQTLHYKGIYQFINHAFAGLLPDKYLYVNREQDLGDPGLRQAKMSYQPCRFIKKYRILR